MKKSWSISAEETSMQFGPGFLATFLYYFGSTAIVFTLVTARALDVSVSSGLPQQMGIVGGLLAGLIGGYFNRTVSFSVPFKNKKVFVNYISDVLSKWSYEKKDEVDGVLVYQRPRVSRFLSGKIFVQIEENTATIASRAGQIKALRKQLEE